MRQSSGDLFMRLYVRRILNSTAYNAMSAAQRGAYCTLLFVCFDQGGVLPSNANALQTLSKCNAQEWQAHPDDLVMQQFTPHPDQKDALTHYLVLEEVAHMGRVSQGRKRGAEARWGGSGANGMQMHSKSNAHAMQNKNKIEIINPPIAPPKQRKQKAVQPDLPPTLALHPGLAEAWRLWGQHLTEKNGGATSVAWARQLAKLAELGPARALAALAHSTERNYTGIFEPKGDFPAPAAQPNTAPTLRIYR